MSMEWMVSKIRDLSFKPKTWEEGEEESGDCKRGEEEGRKGRRESFKIGHKKLIVHSMHLHTYTCA